MTQFKVCDWVEFTVKQPRTFKQVTQRDTEIFDDEQFSELFKLWQPQEDEWCWDKKYGFIKILGFYNDSNKEYYSKLINSNVVQITHLTNLEPFIGQLPSWVK